MDNLSESGASQSSTSRIIGGSSGAIGSGKRKDGSTPIDTYDTSSTVNAPGAKQVDSFTDGITDTQTQKNKNDNK